ncbi:MAG: PorT family protein [Bacteroidales bacterium]|nr:PorT family protein [Bacteroidales bacterium]
MKSRTIITVLLLCFAVSTLTAQKEKKFDIGLQAGYNNTWIINQNNYGLPELDYDSYWGLAYNLQVGYNFTNELGLFTEIGISNQGQKYKGNMNQYDVVKREINMSYLNIPVFFKFSYGESVARFKLLVGPQFCFLQKAEQTYVLDGTDAVDIPAFQDWEMSNHKKVNIGQKDIKERYNSMDVALVLDLGADIFLIEDMLYLSVAARFYYGLTDINATDYQVKNHDGNYEPSHNGGGGFYLGIHYVIGGGN